MMGGMNMELTCLNLPSEYNFLTASKVSSIGVVASGVWR